MKKTLKQRVFGYSGFFSEVSREDQVKYWLDIVFILKSLNIQDNKIEEYKVAFEYFLDNPEKFDGATFVKDLFILKISQRDRFGDRIKLDINAMLHDYEYLRGDFYSFIKITISNLNYVKNIQACGQGLHWTRFIGLTFISLFYVPYKNIKKLLDR